MPTQAELYADRATTATVHVRPPRGTLTEYVGGRSNAPTAFRIFTFPDGSRARRDGTGDVQFLAPGDKREEV